MKVCSFETNVLKLKSFSFSDVCTWSRREVSDRILTRGSVLFYQTKEEVSTKRCSLLTRTSGDQPEMPFSCQTSLVPTGNNQFYLVVQINLDQANGNRYLGMSNPAIVWNRNLFEMFLRQTLSVVSSSAVCYFSSKEF